MTEEKTPDHLDASDTVDPEVSVHEKQAWRDSRVSMKGDVLPGVPKQKEDDHA